MPKFLIIFLCILHTVLGSELAHSLYASIKPDFNAELWEINVQQCLNKSKASCKMLLQGNLKTKDQCKVKTECVVIGEILWNADSLEDALLFFEKACMAKNMRGCYFLGLYYKQQKDFVKAREYFQSACMKKDASSCFELGGLYENGSGIRQEYEKASELYKKACKLHHAHACYRLGILHEEGRTLSHDLSLAKEFYGKTCDLGVQLGCDQYKKLNQAGIPSLYSNKNVFN